MKTATIAAALAATLATTAHAEIFATAGVKGDRDGRTVLTTDPCEIKFDLLQIGLNKATTSEMRRAFYYTSDGKTNEGCWKHDAGTVLLVWSVEQIVRRWPVDNFKVADKKASAWDALR
jgi:hypothetical protein